MNTPAHAIVNLWALGRKDRPELAWPLIAGAFLPDLPIVAFYGWQKLVQGESEARIWNELYHLPGWQTLFDACHSIPLALLAALIAWRLSAHRARALSLSLAAHALGDLPLHHDDSHRHFFPLADWRFRSPFSYWDLAHHGATIATVEGLVVVAGCWVLWRRYEARGVRLLLGATLLLYLAGWGYAVAVWV